MNEFMLSVINGSDLGKAVFLLCVGVTFVFAVQLIFFGVISLFVKIGQKNNS